MKLIPEKLGEMQRNEKMEIAAARLDLLQADLKSCHPKVQEAYLNVPFRHQRLFLEVHVGSEQKSKALKLKCLQCQDWHREKVRSCTEKQCALWKFRPYQEK